MFVFYPVITPVHRPGSLGSNRGRHTGYPLTNFRSMQIDRSLGLLPGFSHPPPLLSHCMPYKYTSCHWRSSLPKTREHAFAPWGPAAAYDYILPTGDLMQACPPKRHLGMGDRRLPDWPRDSLSGGQGVNPMILPLGKGMGRRISDRRAPGTNPNPRQCAI